MTNRNDDLTGYEEHLEFERHAEDMEARARRMEAERSADIEAYWQWREEEERDGGCREN